MMGGGGVQNCPKLCDVIYGRPLNNQGETRGKFHQTVYAQIPKAQKRQSSEAAFFALLGSAQVKAARKQVDEIYPLKLNLLCRELNSNPR